MKTIKHVTQAKQFSGPIIEPGTIRVRSRDANHSAPPFFSSQCSVRGTEKFSKFPFDTSP